MPNQKDTPATSASAASAAPAGYDPAGQFELLPNGVRRWVGPVTVPEDFPTCDSAAFHGAVGDLVRASAEFTEADPIGILGSLLAEASTLIGGGPFVKISGAKQSARLFVMLVGPSAVGRKGTAGGVARTLMEAVGGDRPDGFIKQGFGSGEGLVEALSAADDPRVLIYEEEMAQVIVAMNRDGSTLSMNMRALWDGRSVSHVTAGQQTEVEDSHVNVLGHITPTELKSRLRQVDLANGFANRFLPLAVHRRRAVVWDGGENEEQDQVQLAIAPFTEVVARNIESARQRGHVSLSDAAFRRWVELYRMEAGDGDLGARKDAHILRLALLFTLLSDSPLLEPEHLDAASAMWNYVAASLRWVYGDDIGIGGRASEVLSAVREAGPGGLTLTELTNRFGNHLTKVDRDLALDELVALGLITVVKVSATGGRARTMVVAVEASEEAKQAN